MWLDLLALAILALFGVVGAMRGALRSGMGLLALVVGYLAGIFLAPVVAPVLTDRLGVSDFLALPLGGTAAFIFGYGVVAGVGALLRRLTDHDDDEATPRDRFLGAVFGATRGLLVVVLVSWLALWLDALRATGGTSPIPEIGGSAAAAVTGEVMERSITAALGDQPAGRVAARIAAHPNAALTDLAAVLENGNVAALRGDSLFWTYVEAGSVDAATNRGSFRAVASDAGLRGQLADLALVPPDAANDPGAFRDAFADMLRELGPPLRRLRNDPGLQELVEDPQVVAMVQSGDTLGLLRHRGVRALVGRVTAPESEDPSAVP
jgi:uncharacterized membrane protein required for colicin V production